MLSTQGSIQTAIDGGVDSIEHGNDVTDQQLKTMARQGIFHSRHTANFLGQFFTKMLSGHSESPL